MIIVSTREIGSIILGLLRVLVVVAVSGRTALLPVVGEALPPLLVSVLISLLLVGVGVLPVLVLLSTAVVGLLHASSTISL